MIIEVVRLHAKPGETDDLKAGLTGARAVISQPPGNIDRAFHRGIEEPEAYLLPVPWTDVDAPVIGFRSGPLLDKWRSRFAHHLQSSPKMMHYVSVP
jgi:heme-degrading monooxygenase HmoA